MMSARLLLALAFLPVRFAAVLLGVVAVPVALWRYDRAGRWPRTLETWHNRGAPVYNLPAWYVKRYAPAHWAAKRFPRFWWFAIRNPANNMRYWFGEPDTYETRGWHGPMEPSTARAAGMTLWRYRYSGLFSEIWIIHPWNGSRHLRFRFGWKLGQQDGDAMGYAAQFMPSRRG